MNLQAFYNAFTKNEKQGLFLLFFMALLTRAVYVFIDYSATGTTDFVDDWRYLNDGKSFAGGNWLIHMIDSPWVAMVVAFWYTLTGTAIIPMFVYNILIGALAVPVLFYLGKNTFNTTTGWLLAIWGALCLETFQYYAHILKEPSLFLFFPLTLLLFVKSINIRAWVKNIPLWLSALVFALLVHTDERFFLYFPFLIIIQILGTKENHLVGLKKAIIWGAAVLILMVPWSVRNHVVYDQVVILTPRTTAFTSKIWGEDLLNMDFESDDRIGVSAKIIEEQSLEYAEKYGKEPGLYSRQEARIRAFLFFWQPTLFSVTYISYGHRPQGPWSYGRNLVSLAFFGIFIPFYFIGLVILVKKKNATGFLIALIPLIHSLLHAYMVWSLPRYRAPVLFLIAMVGFWTYLGVFEIIRDKKWKL